MKNVTEISTTDHMDKMMNIVSRDDGRGGTSSVNNNEYGGFINDNIVKEAKSGNAADPSKGQNAAITGDVDFHSHPSGTKKVPQGTAMWAQSPSATDIKTATGKDYVFGMRSGTIYIYTNKGVIATIPLSIFQKK